MGVSAKRAEADVFLRFVGIVRSALYVKYDETRYATTRSDCQHLHDKAVSLCVAFDESSLICGSAIFSRCFGHVLDIIVNMSFILLASFSKIWS